MSMNGGRRFEGVGEVLQKLLSVFHWFVLNSLPSLAPRLSLVATPEGWLNYPAKDKPIQSVKPFSYVPPRS